MVMKHESAGHIKSAVRREERKMLVLSCLRPLSSLIQFMWSSYPYSGNLPSSLRHLSAYLTDMPSGMLPR